eukprot:13091598-Heterocapsa_arctica.AAC.1
MAYASTFELYLEFGNDHFAEIFDRIEEHLDKIRGMKEMLLNHINTRTKATIVQSILGLGLIFRQQGTKNCRTCQTSSTSWKQS